MHFFNHTHTCIHNEGMNKGKNKKITGSLIPFFYFKDFNPEYSLEGLMLQLKLQYFGHLMQRIDSKDPDAGKDGGQEEKGMTEDEMVGWHHRLNGHEFEQTPEDSEGQRSLACCRLRDCRESDTT